MATHKELITPGKFDEKFKRVLLDYYSYGFKRFAPDDSRTTRKAAYANWNRLNSVITDYLEWSEDYHKAMFASADSQSMEENPFHRVYRFCKYKPFVYPACFLHTIAALSGSFSLRGGAEALGLDKDRQERLEALLDGQGPLKTTDLRCFYGEALASSARTANERLNALSALGLVHCERHGGAGDHHWSLSGLTMGRILEAGRGANPDFAHHLHDALEFYAGYALFGEVGTFLLDRIGSEQSSPFRFRHAYFMQSLNDFNLIDLLDAIETQRWCCIEYSHGTAEFTTKLLCYPLEIRVSDRDGREFLMYYEPFRRSYSSLRLEFVDSVTFYGDNAVRDMLLQTGYHTARETIDADIANARDAITHCWGVSPAQTPDDLPGSAAGRIPLRTVTLELSCDPEAEFYIANRLRRECRFGTVEQSEDGTVLRFRADVTDEQELRPWVRSFYSRILDCGGMEQNGFSLAEDVGRLTRQLAQDAPEKPTAAARDGQKTVWGIPEDAANTLGTGCPARTHDLLFNEVFGVYYAIIADVFAQLCAAGDEEAFTEHELNTLIRRAFDRFYLKIGQETEELLPDEIRSLLLSGGFLEETEKIIRSSDTGSVFREAKTERAYRARYACAAGTDLYRDIVPLSVFELRWLQTLLKDEKRELFLSAEETKALREVLRRDAPEFRPLPTDKLIHFDRFHFPKYSLQREAAVLPPLLESIREQKTVHVRYHTMRGGWITGEFLPVLVEFSKRNNRLQGCFLRRGDARVYTMNLSRIQSLRKTGRVFDHRAAEQTLLDWRRTNRKSAEITFYDTANLADRLLTELSPWEKCCTRDPATGLYRLTIFYRKSEETELASRLLGYGAQLCFPDREHPICVELRARAERQLERLRERGTKKERDKDR